MTRKLLERITAGVGASMLKALDAVSKRLHLHRLDEKHEVKVVTNLIEAEVKFC